MNDNPIFQGVRRPSVDLQAVRQGLQTNLMTYTFSLATARSIAAGTALILPIGYTSIYVDAGSTGIATFHFQDQNPNAAGITAYPTSVWEVAGTQLCIENTAQAGASMTIIFGVDSAFRPSNAGGVNLLNPVSIVDGGKARTLSDQSFMGFSQVGAVAAQYAQSSLWNPSATKRLLVQSIIMSSTLAGELALYSTRTAIGALEMTPGSKKIGTAATVASVAQIRRLNNAGTSAVDKIMNGTFSANSPFAWIPRNPISLEPSTGILVVNATLNQPLTVTYEFDEETV